MTDQPTQTTTVERVLHVSSDNLPGTVRDVRLTVPAPRQEVDNG
jgi:hypothetical protein